MPRSPAPCRFSSRSRRISTMTGWPRSQRSRGPPASPASSPRTPRFRAKARRSRPGGARTAAFRAQHAGLGAALSADQGRDPSAGRGRCRDRGAGLGKAARGCQRGAALHGVGLWRHHAGQADRRRARPETGSGGEDRGRDHRLGGGRMALTLWHNPRCAKSRAALALLQERGIAPDIRLYLKSPPINDEIVELLRRLRVPAIGVVRTKEPVFSDLDLADSDDEALVAAMAE